MLKYTDTRELISLDILGHRVRGTYHRSFDDRTSSWMSGTCADRPAVLFLNSLALPRAATGDSAVYWADAFARLGYPTFRFDLPGLGDSDGQASTDLLDFINGGGFAPAAAGISKELVERGGYSGVVLVGHCAGAVTASFAAAAFKKCKGMILLDPYFYLPVAKRPESREKLSGWARHSALGRPLSNLFDRVKHLKLFLRGSALPGNANTRLLRKWKELSSTGLPILLFKAPGIKAQGSKPRVGEFDYLEHVRKLAGRKGNLVMKSIEDSDHSFANRAGREAVRRDAEGWMTAHFPLTNPQAHTKAVSFPSAGNKWNGSSRAMVATPNPDCALEGR